MTTSTKLALKIDVDTFRGTREGVPNLLRLLDKHKVPATFLFSLGPDHTGRALKRVFRPGFLSKVSRTSVVSHYGIRTLMYGVLLPGPDIGKRCADILRSVKAAGHEVGIHTWDHIKWQDGVEHADDAWTEREMNRAAIRFAEIFHKPPRTHGAAGWQMNDHAVELTAKLGFEYSSDGRGHSPFLPYVKDKVIPCPQLPSTLFDQLLSGWKAQGYTLTTSLDLFKDLDVKSLPVHRMVRGTVEGRSGTLMVQGERVLVES